MHYLDCLLSFNRFIHFLSLSSINIMSPLRIRRPDDFHVHLRDGNSMV